MRTLALLLALVLAPQAALASVAAFPETALRGDREISAIRVGSNARQLAETRQETACFYDANASAMTDDPINHRDPTGRLLDVLAVGLAYGPEAAAGYALRIGQHLLSAATSSAKQLFGGVSMMALDAVLGDPIRPETALDHDRAVNQAGVLETLNPLNQALRSGSAAAESSGFDQGVEIADTARGLVDTALLAIGGARALATGFRYGTSANDRAVSAVARTLEIPRVHSRYPDGTIVFEGRQPGKIRGPEAAAGDAPHTVVQWDTANQRIYKAREYGPGGVPVRDIDMTHPTFPDGTLRPNHAAPEQHRWIPNDPARPAAGHKRGPGEPFEP